MDYTAVEQSEESPIAHARGLKHTSPSGTKQRNRFAGLYFHSVFVLFYFDNVTEQTAENKIWA